VTYSVREVFDTLQGEGGRAGARSVFVRFTGCNLWSGLPDKRSLGRGACAAWCDTNFVSGEKMTAMELEYRMSLEWPKGPDQVGRRGRWCVITGGEPTLQLDEELVDLLHAEGWYIARRDQRH
jgi:organic radical activating enzyme